MRKYRKLKIENVMTKGVITIHSNASVFEAKEMITRHGFHHLPVVDAFHKPIGIISLSDINILERSEDFTNAIETRAYNEKYLESLLVEEVMTRQLARVDINESLESVIEILLQNRLHSVLIFEKEELAGIITPFDLLEEIQFGSLGQTC